MISPPVPDAPPVVTERGLEPSEPTLRLPRNFTPTEYLAKLSIDPAKSGFDGAITIAGTVSERSSVIWLHGRHLTVRRASASRGDQATPAGSALAVTPHGEDLLELRAEPALDPGTWRLELEYAGEFDDINTTGAFKEKADNLPYVYTQFEAVYARRVFPCLDEPDSKVPWTLTLEVPKGQVAVSNTPIESDTALGDGGHRVTFAKTKPLPSYLIAFGVGPFEIVPAGSTKRGMPVRIFTFKGHGAEVAYPAKTAARLIDQLEDWFGMPFPYPKLDFLTIPLTSGFGAMENAGLITAAQRYTNLDAHPSWERRLTWIRGASHELAHQWFGDLVTTAWWDDIWLNEGFANWMENKMTTRFEPAWHAEVDELEMRMYALRSDSLVTARRIRQPIETPGDILNVFDGITYDKGASVLNMFETYVGRDAFQAGVRAYMAERAYGNATSADFVAAISKLAGKDLAPAFATFLDQAGAPELAMTIACGNGAPRVELAQQRFVPPGSAAPPATKPWILPVCVAYDRNGKRAETCTLLDAATGSLALDTKTCPRWVMPNVNGRGYFYTQFTTTQVTALRDEAWPQLLETERRTIFHDVMTSASYPQHGTKLPLVLALSLVPRMLTNGDRFTIGDALELPGSVETFVADDQRGKYEAWYRMTFGPGATKLGVVPKESDDLDAEAIRVNLFGAAAWAGREPELTKHAVELAQTWRDLPDAIRERVLAVAVDASPELFDKVRGELKSEPRRDHRATMIAALAAVRDPKRYETALAITLDPALDFRETRAIVFDPSIEPTRKLAEAFFRAHKDELDKRLPQDEVSGALYAVISLFTRACDPAHRDEVVDYLTKNFASRPGGERALKQSTERLDQCLAMRKVLEPEVRGWLGGVKIPRPPAAKKK